MDRQAEILGRVRPSPFYTFVAAISWPFVRWLYRLRAEGVENLPQAGGKRVEGTGLHTAKYLRPGAHSGGRYGVLDV